MSRRSTMDCPECGGPSGIVQTDRLEDGTIVRRRRCCDREGCGWVWTTQQLAEVKLDSWRLRWRGGHVIAIRPPAE